MENENKTNIYKCPVCQKEFNSKEALEMHNSSKHETKAKKAPFKFNKKYLVYGIILLVIIGFVWFIKNNPTPDCETQPASEMNIDGHTNLAMHIHSVLKIIINGKEQDIPSNIGLMGNNIMRPIHTHDASGTVHIEAPCTREFKLKEFFEIWGKQFNNNCIFDYCKENGEMKVTINDVIIQDPENQILRNGDNLII